MRNCAKQGFCRIAAIAQPLSGRKTCALTLTARIAIIGSHHSNYNTIFRKKNFSNQAKTTQRKKIHRSASIKQLLAERKIRANVQILTFAQEISFSLIYQRRIYILNIVAKFLTIAKAYLYMILLCSICTIARKCGAQHLCRSSEIP